MGTSRSLAPRITRSRIPARALDLDQMFIVRQLQDGVAGADAEDRDQSHHGAEEMPMPVAAIASTLPIRLKGRLASTSQLLARQ